MPGAGPMRIKAQLVEEEIAIGEFCDRPATEQDGAELGDLKHQLMLVKARAVPFQQGKLGVVAMAGFPAAKAFANLINGPASSRQQPLHGEFGRGLQVRWLGPVDAKAGQMHVRRSGPGQNRGLDLEHLPGGEKLP